MHVIASAAVSLDGFIDDGSPKRRILSSAEDLQAVHKLRASCDAILVGANTVRKDNPSLTARTEPPAYPVKVTLTRSGSIPTAARFFTDGSSEKIVYAPQSVHERLQITGATLIDHIGDLSDALEDLRERGIKRLLIEGGAEILHELVENDLADEFRLALSPILMDDQTGTKFMTHTELNEKLVGRMIKYETMQLGDTVVTTYIRAT